MPYIVIWSPGAVEDVTRAYLFLAEKDATAAQAAAGAMYKHAEILQAFPNAGRPADDLDPEHRELLIPFGASGFVLVYEVVSDHVHILAVRHQKEVGY